MVVRPHRRRIIEARKRDVEGAGLGNLAEYQGVPHVAQNRRSALAEEG